MRMIKLGRTGLDISPLCLGCMSYGVPERGTHAWTLDEFGLWSWSSSFGLETFRYRDWMLGAGAVFSLIGILGVLRRPA